MMNLSKQDELYNPRKAAQLIAYFALKQGKGVIDIVKAVKLTYLADRESLRRWGAPILHEPRVSMKFGPVNRTTYDYINGERVDAEGWSRILSPRGTDSKTIELRPGVVLEDLDEFSTADLEAMEAVWDRHGQTKTFALAIWTHQPGNVPEWEDPKGSSKPIELIDILRAVGFPNPEVAVKRIEEQRYIERKFRQLACQS